MVLFAGVLLATLTGLPYVAPVFASALITGLLAIVAWRYPRRPGRRSFILLMSSVTIWSASYGLGLLTPARGPRVFLEQVQWIGIAFVPVWWLTFALEYAGFDRLVTTRTVAGMSVVPTITILMAFTNPLHRLFWASERLVIANDVAVMVQAFGPWYLLNLVYGYTLIVIGTLIMLRLAFSYDALYMDQSIALTIAALVPFVGNVLSNLGIAPLPGLDLTPFTFAITGIGIALAMFRYELFGLLPMTRQIGRDMAIADLEDGVIIVDAEGHIVDANETAWNLMAVSHDSILGEPFGEVFDVPDATDPTKIPPILHFDSEAIYDVSTSEIHDNHDRLIGHAIILREVTEERLREQRLEVQNRVLRHNLRNEVIVIQGNVELVAQETSSSAETPLERIRSSVESLVSLSNRASEIDSIIEYEFEPMRIDLTAIVGQTVDQMRVDYPECQVEAEVPTDLTIVSYQYVIEVVIEQLLRNAAEHGDPDDPKVWIEVEVADETVRLCVRDNGPGIPEYETSVLTAEGETPLNHGSGMGLWIVKWGTQRLGAELAFEDRGTGTAVEITIPDLSERGAIVPDTPQLDEGPSAGSMTRRG